MPRINPNVLRQERERKQLSLDDLARRSGIDRQSIHRIEQGDKKRNRNDVVEKLARALGVSADALCNVKTLSMPEKGTEEIDELLSSSQLNLRISDRSRNALALVASRYKITLAEIVEISPLLFCWVAEESLKQRRERLVEIERKNNELWLLQPSHLHAAGFANQRSENLLQAERQSIEQNDIFGKSVDGDDYESFLPESYEEAIDNPFAVFLRNLTEKMESLATFEEWEPESSPKYLVCRSKVVEYVAGDEVAADEILDGSVLLHKLPKELREKGMGEARAKWVHDEAATRLKRLGINPSDLF